MMLRCPALVAMLVLSAVVAVGSSTAFAQNPTTGIPAWPADRAAPRTDQNSMTAHAQLLEKRKQGRIDIYFEGDSIVRRWGALDYPINDRLADSSGALVDGVLNERDRLHPTLKGYQIWADALKPLFRELLGPPATTDLVPPPTGDPSAARRQH